MPKYLAKFRKRVLSDTGHETWVVQHSFDIEARDRVNAERLATQRFCETQGIKSWTDHADDVLIEEADFPS